eukprot:TRINITY_DN3537_c0_g1_i2.p1 TRINITY_DN3537_c0_g1~~TRINITY_DN3537_c0_g1_i2.p1  ORF type:complete len:139 (+),score=20.99 TRINITY_DN3537_c0_g1_i2:93-509(+)
MCISVSDVNSLTHTRNYVGHTSHVYSLALTDDEQQLVSGSNDETVKVWCTTSHTLLRTITPPLGHSIFSIAVSQKSDVLAVAPHGYCGRVCLLKFSTGVSVGTPVDQFLFAEIALSPCGTRVFTRGKHGVQVSATNTA